MSFRTFLSALVLSGILVFLPARLLFRYSLVEASSSHYNHVDHWKQAREATRYLILQRQVDHYDLNTFLLSDTAFLNADHWPCSDETFTSMILKMPQSLVIRLLEEIPKNSITGKYDLDQALVEIIHKLRPDIVVDWDETKGVSALSGALSSRRELQTDENPETRKADDWKQAIIAIRALVAELRVVSHEALTEALLADSAFISADLWSCSRETFKSMIHRLSQRDVLQLLRDIPVNGVTGDYGIDRELESIIQKLRPDLVVDWDPVHGVPAYHARETDRSPESGAAL